MVELKMIYRRKSSKEVLQIKTKIVVLSCLLISVVKNRYYLLSSNHDEIEPESLSQKSQEEQKKFQKIPY